MPIQEQSICWNLISDLQADYVADNNIEYRNMLAPRIPDNLDLDIPADPRELFELPALPEVAEGRHCDD